MRRHRGNVADADPPTSAEIDAAVAVAVIRGGTDGWRLITAELPAG